MRIYKNDGAPYATERAADTQAKKKLLEYYTIVAVDGGYAIEDGMLPAGQTEPEKIVTPMESKAQPPLKDTKQDDKKKVLNVTDLGYEIYEDDDEETRILLGGEWKDATDAFKIIDPYKDKRFVYKWANPKNKNGSRVDELIGQGWQVDPVMYKHVRKLNTYRDYGTDASTNTIIRGHLLMRIPRHMAAQRNKKFSDMANAGLMRQQEELKERTGGNTYGQGVYKDTAVPIG